MFSNKDLRNLIFPLFVEQFLLMLVGIADTFVASFSSEADVSVVILLFDDQLLSLLFGKVEPEVMKASKTYLIITTWSLPALAVYDAGAALCRSIGKTKATMYISTVANIINIIGNCIGVFVLDLGAAGVAYPAFISRILSAVAVTMYCFNRKNQTQYRVNKIFAWDGSLLKKIMGIALPNGIENGIHQLVKVALSSMVALFGTYQIAANGVAQSIWSLASIMGLAMAPAYTTVIGQCMGARDIDSANYYFKKLNKITLILSVLWNAFVFAITPFIVQHSAISAEAKSLVIWLVLIRKIRFAGQMVDISDCEYQEIVTLLVSLTRPRVANPSEHLLQHLSPMIFLTLSTS